METFLGSRTRFLPPYQQQKLLKYPNDSVTRTGFWNHFRLKPPNINSAIPFKRSRRSLNSNFVQIIEIHLLIFKVTIGPSKDIQFVIKLTKSSIISWLYKIVRIALTDRPLFIANVIKMKILIDFDLVRIESTIQQKPLIFDRN